MTNYAASVDIDFFEKDHALWLIENIEGEWFVRGGQDIEDEEEPYIVTVMFKLEEDAAAFKLRWV